MKIEWRRTRMSANRVDIDLHINGSMVGFFRDYKPGRFEWVGDSNGGYGQFIDQSNLKEAKAVVQALVLLEG